jgi:hypothetical protein
MFYSQNEKTNARFLVAKYIPDMRRLEPRNIGVIVWVNGVVSARFLGEPAPGNNDVARPPRRLGIKNQQVYQEWLQYWRAQMSQPKLSVNGNGKQVSRESPEFIDALRKRSKENFVLIDGGFIAGEVSPAEIDDVAYDLFDALVEETHETGDILEEDGVLLKKAISRVFRASGIDGTEGYKARIPLTFPVESHNFAFTFDWGIYTNVPRLLCQHAVLTRPMTVNSAAFMFNCLARSDHQPFRLGKDRCLALVRTTPKLLDNDLSHIELEKLNAYGTVIDVSDEERSVNQLRAISFP